MCPAADPETFLKDLGEMASQMGMSGGTPSEEAMKLAQAFKLSDPNPNPNPDPNPNQVMKPPPRTAALAISMSVLYILPLAVFAHIFSAIFFYSKRAGVEVRMAHDL